jgi:hypothetical protein
MPGELWLVCVYRSLPLAALFVAGCTVYRCIVGCTVSMQVRMLASGLVGNLSVTHLNLSHNKVADRGVRALAKLLDQR